VYFAQFPRTLHSTPANKELPDVSGVPVCPLHKKSMIRVEAKADTHYKCSQYECPIHWNPITALYYLKSQCDWFLQERPD
jgi:hypothetical protein